MIKSAGNTVFHFYDLDRAHSFNDGLFLFNTALHLHSQARSNWRVYELLHEQTQQVTARISFFHQEDKALSPFRAPFGGLEVFDKCTLQELIDFIRLVETDLKSHGIKSVIIRMYPELYSKSVTLIANAFKDLHYRSSKESTSIIQVDSKSFERKIKISERQKLRKAKELFQFEQVRLKDLKEIYSFIATCRKERDQSLSMTFAELSKTCELFPDRFLLFKVSNKEGIAVACISIKVSDQVLYTFYYGHLRKYDKISPVVWMMSGIYDFAKSAGFKLIDLGSSSVNGRLSRSLLHFKKSIGGVNSDKHIFEKSFI